VGRERNASGRTEGDRLEVCTSKKGCCYPWAVAVGRIEMGSGLWNHKTVYVWIEM
jgi:hypothetical protein